MPISRRLKRLLTLVLLAALGFAQASIALAACELDRGSLAQAMESEADCPCAEPSGELTVGCVAHCTADLQLAGAATVIARAPGDTPVLLVVPGEPRQDAREWQAAHPPGGLPARILFQSFLI